jgi:hypothetical protein
VSRIGLVFGGSHLRSASCAVRKYPDRSFGACCYEGLSVIPSSKRPVQRGQLRMCHDIFPQTLSRPFVYQLLYTVHATTYFASSFQCWTNTTYQLLVLRRERLLVRHSHPWRGRLNSDPRMPWCCPTYGSDLSLFRVIWARNMAFRAGQSSLINTNSSVDRDLDPNGR